MGDDRPARYVENGRVVYRASSLGACDRVLVACAYADAYPPAPTPDWLQEVFDEGVAAEPRIAAMWDAVTMVPTTGQQMEVELEVGEFAGHAVVVRCHIDGQAGVANVGREFKKFRDSTWDNFVTRGVEVHRNYPWQVAAMMWATGWEWEVVGGRWVDGDVVEVLGMHLAEPPLPFRAIWEKVRRVEQLISHGFDPREAPCDGGMYPCPQWKLHDVPDDAYELPVDGELGVIVQTAVLEHLGASQRIRELEGEMAVFQNVKRIAGDQIRGVLEELGQADAPKMTAQGGLTVVHIRKHIPEHTRKAQDQDYFMVKQSKGKRTVDADTTDDTAPVQ